LAAQKKETKERRKKDRTDWNERCVRWVWSFGSFDRLLHLFCCDIRPLIVRDSFQLGAFGALFGSSSTVHSVRIQHNLCLLAFYVAGYSSRPRELGSIKLLPAASVASCRSQALWSIQEVRDEGQCGASLLCVPASSAIY
jgi:hypothetical protein